MTPSTRKDRPNLQSVTDIFQSVFILVQRRESGPCGVLLISASPSLQQLPGVPEFPFHMVSPGVYKFSWDVSTLKSTALLLRTLGYYVFIYDHTSLRTWSSTLSAVPVQSSTVAADLVGISKALPSCSTYVELFGGRTPLFLSRDPAPVEVINDYSRLVISFFHTLREPLAFSWIYLLSKVLSPSNEFSSCGLWTVLQSSFNSDELISVYAWYCYMRRAFPDSTCDNTYRVPPEDPVRRTLSALHLVDALLPVFHSRLYRMQVEHNTIDKVLQIYDSADTLFWVHPPYDGDGALDLEGTRQLLEFLTSTSGHVAIYDDREAANPHVAHLLEETPTDLSRRWKPTTIGSSQVYVKR